MGFSETQAMEMHEVATESCGKHVQSVLTALLLLGLNISSILKIMQKCPEVYSLKGADLQLRINHLRKMGLVEGSLQRMISRYPEVMLLPVKRVNMVSRLLREKCLFTIHQVTDILRDSPEVLEQDLAQLEYKFQETYLAQVAMADADEFHVFLKLMAREQEEEGREDEYSSDEELGEDKDDDEDDNGLLRRKRHWNTGYKKDRK